MMSGQQHSDYVRFARLSRRKGDVDYSLPLAPIEMQKSTALLTSAIRDIELCCC